MTRKLVSLILTLALALTMASAALADYYSNLLPIVTTYAPEFQGKTVILHSNDVHGAIDGYAFAAGGDTYNAFNRAYVAGAGFDTGIPVDQAMVHYVAEALGGKITAEQYGQPRGSMTLILPEATEAEAVDPAA